MKNRNIEQTSSSGVKSNVSHYWFLPNTYELNGDIFRLRYAGSTYGTITAKVGGWDGDYGAQQSIWHSQGVWT